MSLVVLLRGVNVGGHRRFRPTTLAHQLRRFDAVNIGAAGTFVIRRPVTRTTLRAELTRRLPFATEIMICDSRELARIAARDPFAREPARPGVVRFMSILSKRPRLAPATPIQFPAEGPWLLKVLGREGRFVYGVHRRHMKVISYLGELDRVFGVPATTRSWSTIAAIANVRSA